jgi:TRAP transporter 4TM/12TM fusion protein
MQKVSIKHEIIEKVVSLFAVLLCAYIFYATIWGPYKTTIVHRAIFLGVMIIIFFWSTKPLGKGHVAFFIDTFLLIAAVFSLGYVVIFWKNILEAIGGTYLSPVQLLAGMLIILVVLEAVRRISLPLFAIALCAIAYTFFGNYVPGAFSHAGMGFKRFIYLTAFSHEGVFGLGLAVASTYIFMFMLFSTALQQTGASDFFLKLTNSLVGKTRGGPAKSAVLASGLTGSMIGSSIGNVVTTGSITIPLMKKSGFMPHVAAAIEVVASEGAQLVPPIMGAGAFLMAELTGIPYSRIALAAIIPAVLYYVSVFIVIDLTAVKIGMRGLRETEKTRKIILQGIHYLIPITMLFYLLLVMRLSPTYAGLITVLITVAINQIQKKTRFGVVGIYSIFANGTKMCAELTALIAVIGVVQQAFTITGLGHRLSEIILSAAGGYPILALVMAMAISIILGMGLPTPIAYLLSGIFVAPALVEMGFPELGSHLFIFFFAIKSGSTPPIAVVAVVAAGIARANWWKTAWLSFVYSLPGFFIAYSFVLYPGYLMEGTWTDILITSSCGLIAVSGFSFAMQRYLLTDLAFPKSLLLGFGSFAIIFSQAVVHLIVGFICITFVVLSQMRRYRRVNPDKEPIKGNQ